MHRETLLESQKQVDEAIEVLKSQIRALYTSRNAFALVNQLPIETLTEIFLWLQISILASNKPYQRNSFLVWMRVTHVSKYWRTVAFNSKALWTDIPIHHLAYAELASQLSHPLPISLTDNHSVGWAISPTNDDLGTLLPLLPRVRKLEYDANSREGEIFGKALQDAPEKSPWLREMILGDFTFKSEASPFPDSLKVLELRQSQTPFIWSRDWLKLNHLTDLCLEHINPEIPVHSFLDAMVQIPKLSCLEVGWIFHLPPTSTPVLHPTSRTPPTLTLQRLILEDHVISMTTFLQNVKFKEFFTLKIGLCATWDLPDELQVAEFFHQVDSHLLAQKRIIRSGTFMKGIWGTTTFTGFVQDIDGSTPPPLEIQINDDDMADETMGLFMHFIQRLTFDHLEKLVINVFTDIAEWEFSGFKSLKNLRELDLRGHDTSLSFLCFLEAEVALAAEDTETALSFPSVKHITLHGLNMDYTHGMDTATAFANRATHGCPTNELTLVSGIVRNRWVRELRGAIDKVTVKVDGS